MYTSLKDKGCGPKTRVAIIGVGGLGHFGILWAKALGAARVVGISRRESKRAEVLQLGADDYIATLDEKDWAKTHAESFDLIVCTVSSPDMPLREYMGLLDSRGRLIQVGAPEDKLPELWAFDFILKGRALEGSVIGSPQEIEEMLQLAVEKKVVPWVEERPMSDANQALLDLDAGLARYRYTLVNEKHA
jgi:alcohol dehydrogenase (NADP+)